MICRPADQARPLTQGLEAAGAEVISAPTIRIAGPADGGVALRAAVADLRSGDWLIVTSPNGAIRAAAAGANSLPSGANVAAIGPGTAERARRAGIQVHLVPARSIAEGLLEEFPAPPQDSNQARDGRPRKVTALPAPRRPRVVLCRATAARAVLPDGLRVAGWDVLDVPAYDTKAATLEPAQRRQVACADAVVLTSSSMINSLVSQVGTEAVPPIVATIGPATSATAARHGLRVTIEAPVHTIDGLVDALCRHIKRLPRKFQ